jgi:hypothetical protein
MEKIQILIFIPTLRVSMGHTMNKLKLINKRKKGSERKVRRECFSVDKKNRLRGADHTTRSNCNTRLENLILFTREHD